MKFVNREVPFCENAEEFLSNSAAGANDSNVHNVFVCDIFGEGVVLAEAVCRPSGREGQMPFVT